MDRRNLLLNTAALLIAGTPSSVFGSALNGIKISKSDHVLGLRTAPLAVIEYASLTCPYCASFHNKTLPRIAKPWITTGRMSLTFRHYPLDGMSLRAALVAEAIENEKDFFDFISKLFAHQDAWTKTHNSTDYLIDMAMEFGMPLERAKMALNDKEIIRRVLTGLVSARDELNVKSTPTFFINDKMYPGLIEYNDFVRVLDSF